MSWSKTVSQEGYYVSWYNMCDDRKLTFCGGGEFYYEMVQKPSDKTSDKVFHQQFQLGVSLKKAKNIPDPSSRRYLQLIFRGAGKGKDLPQSQTLKLTTGLPSNIAVEFNLPSYFLPLLLESTYLTGLWINNIFPLCFMLQEELIPVSDPSEWCSELLVECTGDILITKGIPVHCLWEAGRGRRIETHVLQMLTNDYTPDTGPGILPGIILIWTATCQAI